MRALLIEWEPNGNRAGNINNKDVNLQCHGWQNMDITPMLELRIVEDERDLTYLDGVDGVTIIEGKGNINEAIDTYFPPKYHITDEFIFQEHFKQKNKKPGSEIDIDGLPDDYSGRLKILKNTHGLKGVAVKERNHV